VARSGRGRGGAREAGVKDLSALVDVGLGGLVQLFLQIAKDGMSRMLDPDQLIASGKSPGSTRLKIRPPNPSESVPFPSDLSAALDPYIAVHGHPEPEYQDKGIGRTADVPTNQGPSRPERRMATAHSRPYC
jgi:hypothetical protein